MFGTETEGDTEMEHVETGTEYSYRPGWWVETHTSAWDRIKAAFRRDWEQTKADFSSKPDINQDVPDTLRQAAGTQPIPPPNVPNPEVEQRWTKAEPAYRYGYGARTHYKDQGFTTWDDKLEAKLRTEWNDFKSGRTWDEVKGDVRYGWDYFDKDTGVRH